MLVAGTDPTGGGGVIPGYSNQRQIELLVEAGFTPLEAIRIGTLNGAKYLGRDARVGTIAVGKQADLVVDRRRSVEDDRRHPQGRDGVQDGDRVRSGEADCVGERESRALVRARDSANPTVTQQTAGTRRQNVFCEFWTSSASFARRGRVLLPAAPASAGIGNRHRLARHLLVAVRGQIARTPRRSSSSSSCRSAAAARSCPGSCGASSCRTRSDPG